MTDQRLRNRNGEAIEDDDGFLLPHFRTFAAVWNTFTRTYRYTWDEATKHSPTNALAMRRDAFIMGCLQERYLQVAQLPWHLEAESAQDSTESSVASALTDILKATDRWHHFTMQLAEAIWYGRFANQVRWDAAPVNGQTRLIITDHRPVNGDKIQFGFDGTPRVMIHAADATKLPGAADAIVFGDRGPMLELKDPRWRQRFVIHKHIPNDADYFEGEMAGGVHGVGLRSLVYWLWWLRDEMLGWAVNHLKKIGVGGILVFYYEEGNAASKTAAEQAAQDAGDRYALAMPKPRGSSKDVSHAEMLPFNEAGVQSLTTVISDYFERHIERLIIGQTLSSKAQGTGMGSSVADLHADTKFRILKFDAENLADTLTRDLVAVAQRWNFPGMGFRVRLVFDIPHPDAKDKLDAAAKLYSMKVPLRANDIRSVAGFGKPQAGDEIVAQEQMPPDQRNENNSNAKNGSTLSDSVPFQGSSLVQYAKWVRFDEKGNRIGWSDAEDRPEGSGWQAYTKPKTRSATSNDDTGRDSVSDTDQNEGRNSQSASGSASSDSEPTAPKNSKLAEFKKNVDLVLSRLKPCRFPVNHDESTMREIAAEIGRFESGKGRSLATERILSLLTGLALLRSKSWDTGGLLDFGQGDFICLLDSKHGFSGPETQRGRQARISGHNMTAGNRIIEADCIAQHLGLPIRAGYACFVDGEGIAEDLKARRGWYFVQAHNFAGELSLREDDERVKIPLITGPDISIRSLHSLDFANKLSERLKEEIMKIDPEQLRQEIESASKEVLRDQCEFILGTEKGEKIFVEKVSGSEKLRQAILAKSAESKDGQRAMLESLGISQEEYEEFQRKKGKSRK